MRIEIVKQLSPLEQERYEFVVYVYSSVVRITFKRYRYQTKKSVRKKTWDVIDHWLADGITGEYIPASIKLDKPPKVPADVYKSVRANLDKAIAYDFVVDYSKQEAASELRN